MEDEDADCGDDCDGSSDITIGFLCSAEPSIRISDGMISIRILRFLQIRINLFMLIFLLTCICQTEKSQRMKTRPFSQKSKSKDTDKCG